jgi:hypothetical protein
VDPWWLTLLREQQSENFADLAGTRASITIPISEELVSRTIAQHMSPRVPIREFDLTAHPGDIIAIRVRPTKPAFAPSIRIRLKIDQQPVLPSSPILGLAVQSQGIFTVLASALSVLGPLVPGVRFDGHRVMIDLAAILERRRAAYVLAYFSSLKLTTAEGQLIVHADLALPPGGNPRHASR